MLSCLLGAACAEAPVRSRWIFNPELTVLVPCGLVGKAAEPGAVCGVVDMRLVRLLHWACGRKSACGTTMSNSRTHRASWTRRCQWSTLITRRQGTSRPRPVVNRGSAPAGARGQQAVLHWRCEHAHGQAKGGAANFGMTVSQEPTEVVAATPESCGVDSSTKCSRSTARRSRTRIGLRRCCKVILPPAPLQPLADRPTDQ